MNDPEVIMPSALPSSRLVARSAALDSAGLAIRLVMKVPARLRSPADQVARAASSVPANLAEGHGRFGNERASHRRVAHGSAKEIDAHLHLLVEVGAVDRTRAAAALCLLDEARAMT